MSTDAGGHRTGAHRTGAVAPVVDALRAAFVDDHGVPVAVETQLVGPDDLAVLTPDGHNGQHGFVVHVLGPDTVAAVLPGVPVTAAVLVADDKDRVLMYTAAAVGERPAAVAAAISTATGSLADTVGRMRAEATVVDALHSIGRRLTAQLDIGMLVQDATDAATTATGAAFGAFFYNLINELGESYTLYTLSGVPREAFSKFPMPRNTAVFAPTFDGTGTVRSPDIISDRRFGRNDPHFGMPKGHLPVRSYLAVSVISPTTGEVLGGFFFGHPDEDRFTQRHEYLAEGIAGYAAIALDNARLFDRERNLAMELARSMLPTVPAIDGLDIVTRYLPAATGIKVGGDWFDVIELTSDRTAFVIGDVVGHGVTAAAVMGQVRTAIRSYALLDLQPAELLRNVSQLTANLPEYSFVTCFYAVHDPADDTLVYANAGHLPAVLTLPDGSVEQIGEAMAQPLGVGTKFAQRQTDFPPGSDLVLYTDGLVESGTRDLTLGIEMLLTALTEVRTGPDTELECDRLIEKLTHGGHDDDIALIHVHHRNGGER